MKTLVCGFLMCQSMFCALPCPWNVWDEKARNTMLLWLPAVGLEIGLIWFGLGWICRMLQLPAMIAGLVLAAYPFLITGYIHLDGFMDVTDAVRSCRSLERRREILKDSHVGSFAVIGCILLMIAQFALFASLRAEADLRVLILVPAVSRCCSVLAVLTLPKMTTSQYAATEKDNKRVIPLVVLIVCIAAGFMLFGKYGFVTLAACAGYAVPLRKAFRSLEGMNGDISGYSQTISELTAVAVLVLL